MGEMERDGLISCLCNDYTTKQRRRSSQIKENSYVTQPPRRDAFVLLTRLTRQKPKFCSVRTSE
jgi:hypothetical protein